MDETDRVKEEPPDEYFDYPPVDYSTDPAIGYLTVPAEDYSTVPAPTGDNTVVKQEEEEYEEGVNEENAVSREETQDEVPDGSRVESNMRGAVGDGRTVVKEEVPNPDWENLMRGEAEERLMMKLMREEDVKREVKEEVEEGDSIQWEGPVPLPEPTNLLVYNGMVTECKEEYLMWKELAEEIIIDYEGEDKDEVQVIFQKILNEPSLMERMESNPDGLYEHCLQQIESTVLDNDPNNSTYNLYDFIKKKSARRLSFANCEGGKEEEGEEWSMKVEKRRVFKRKKPKVAQKRKVAEKKEKGVIRKGREPKVKAMRKRRQSSTGGEEGGKEEEEETEEVESAETVQPDEPKTTTRGRKIMIPDTTPETSSPPSSSLDGSSSVDEDIYDQWGDEEEEVEEATELGKISATPRPTPRHRLLIRKQLKYRAKFTKISTSEELMVTASEVISSATMSISPRDPESWSAFKIPKKKPDVVQAESATPLSSPPEAVASTMTPSKQAPNVFYDPRRVAIKSRAAEAAVSTTSGKWFDPRMVQKKKKKNRRKEKPLAVWTSQPVEPPEPAESAPLSLFGPVDKDFRFGDCYEEAAMDVEVEETREEKGIVVIDCFDDEAMDVEVETETPASPTSASLALPAPPPPPPEIALWPASPDQITEPSAPPVLPPWPESPDQETPLPAPVPPPRIAPLPDPAPLAPPVLQSKLILDSVAQTILDPRYRALPVPPPEIALSPESPDQNTKVEPQPPPVPRPRFTPLSDSAPPAPPVIQPQIILDSMARTILDPRYRTLLAPPPIRVPGFEPPPWLQSPGTRPDPVVMGPPGPHLAPINHLPGPFSQPVGLFNPFPFIRPLPSRVVPLSHPPFGFPPPTLSPVGPMSPMPARFPPPRLGPVGPAVAPEPERAPMMALPTANARVMSVEGGAALFPLVNDDDAKTSLLGGELSLRHMLIGPIPDAMVPSGCQQRREMRRALGIHPDIQTRVHGKYIHLLVGDELSNEARDVWCRLWREPLLPIGVPRSILVTCVSWRATNDSLAAYFSRSFGPVVSVTPLLSACTPTVDMYAINFQHRLHAAEAWNRSVHLAYENGQAFVICNVCK